MEMDIDDARQDVKPARIDFFARLAGNLRRDLHDAAAFNGHVGAPAPCRIAR